MIIVRQDRKAIYNFENILSFEILQIEKNKNKGKYAIYELDNSGELEPIRILWHRRESKRGFTKYTRALRWIKKKKRLCYGRQWFYIYWKILL